MAHRNSLAFNYFKSVQITGDAKGVVLSSVLLFVNIELYFIKLKVYARSLNGVYYEFKTSFAIKDHPLREMLVGETP